MTSRVYLAGPMTGLPAFNFPAFDYAAAQWRDAGYDVVNPAEEQRKRRESTDLPWAHYLRHDLRHLLDCDAIALLPGWRQSKGATLEHHVAVALGMPVYDATTLEPLPEESALQEAQRLVHGDRGAAYGHPIDDYTRTGRMWGAILGIPDIDPRLCCLMMGAVKISRETNAPKRDNRVDLAGYAECAQMVADEQHKRRSA